MNKQIVAAFVAAAMLVGDATTATSQGGRGGGGAGGGGAGAAGGAAAGSSGGATGRAGTGRIWRLCEHRRIARKYRDCHWRRFDGIEPFFGWG